MPVDGLISFQELSGGPPAAKPVSVKVRSDDFAELRAASDAMINIVKNIPGTRDIVDNDVPGRQELVLDLDYKAIRNAGLTPGHVARLLRLHLDGEVVAFMRDRGEKVELRVRGLNPGRQDISSVLNDPIALPGGGTTSFGALAKTRVSQGRGVITSSQLSARDHG